MPYFLSNDVIANDLVASGCKVITVLYEKSSVNELKHCASNLRTFIVETDQPTLIPHFVYWNGLGMGGRSMLTMTGRKPTCLRCSLPGHSRKNCETPYCRRCKPYGQEMVECTGAAGRGLLVKISPTSTSSTRMRSTMPSIVSLSGQWLS